MCMCERTCKNLKEDFHTQETWHQQTCMKDKALNLKKKKIIIIIIDDDPRLTAKLVMKKDQLCFSKFTCKYVSRCTYDM